MQYILFILIVSSITMFISESNLGLFIRHHYLLKEKTTEIPLNVKEFIYEMLGCTFCTAFHVGYLIAFTFEYYNIDLLLLNGIIGPVLYGFLASITSFVICSFIVYVSKLAHN